MSTINKVILIGNLGDEVVLHRFEDGGCMGRFPIATSESWKDKVSLQKITSTEWHNIIVRNKTAEICEKYLSKGSKIYIEGKLKTRKWTDTNNIERYSTEVIATSVKFLSPKKENESTESAVDAYNANQESKNTENKQGAHDDLPF